MFDYIWLFSYWVSVVESHYMNNYNTYTGLKGDVFLNILKYSDKYCFQYENEC